MLIRAEYLRKCVIRPVLQAMELHSAEAEELLMMTAAQESKLGYHSTQLGRGPALGLYGIEPSTHKDILRYLSRRTDLAQKVGMFAVKGSDDELVWNLAYATAIARIKYYMIPTPIPSTVKDQASYYKKYFNTYLGKATVQEVVNNYRSEVLD